MSGAPGLALAGLIGLVVAGTLLTAAIATGKYLARRDERRREALGPNAEPWCKSYVTETKRRGVLDDDVAGRQQAIYSQFIARHYPPAQTPAGRRGHDLHRAIAKAAETGLWADNPGRHVRAGAPDAVRQLLAGIGDTLLNEAAAAVVRGDERNARHLLMLEEGVRDARDAIVD